jgi:hypothetical protein
VLLPTWECCGRHLRWVWYQTTWSIISQLAAFEPAITLGLTVGVLCTCVVCTNLPWIMLWLTDAGPDTKVVRNMLPAPRKVTRLETAMNRVVMVVLAVLATAAVVLGTLNMVWEVRHRPARDWFLGEQVSRTYLHSWCMLQLVLKGVERGHFLYLDLERAACVCVCGGGVGMGYHLVHSTTPAGAGGALADVLVLVLVGLLTRDICQSPPPPRSKPSLVCTDWLACCWPLASGLCGPTRLLPTPAPRPCLKQHGLLPCTPFNPSHVCTDWLARAGSWCRLLAGPSGALHHPAGSGSAHQPVCQLGNSQGGTVQGGWVNTVQRTVLGCGWA